MKTAPALIAFVLLFSSQAAAQAPKPAPPPPPVAEYNPANWKPFTSSEGGFTASMPGTPTPDTNSVDTALGRIEIHLNVLTTKLGEYGVSYFDLPVLSDDPAVLRAMFDGSRNEHLANGAKLLNENDITVDGILGRELILDRQGLIGRHWVFFVSGRMYVVILAAPPHVAFTNGKPSSNSSDRTVLYETTCRRFFGSFKFTPRKTSTSAPEQARDGVLDPISVKTDLYPADADAKKEIDDALKKAAAGHKRVMLIFGGNWCYDCHVLDQALHAGEAGRIVKEHYLVVHVDIGEGDKNLDLISKYKATLNKGVPVVTILAADARILYGSTNGEFESARRMMKKDLVAFLKSWRVVKR